MVRPHPWGMPPFGECAWYAVCSWFQTNDDPSTSPPSFLKRHWFFIYKIFYVNSYATKIRYSHSQMGIVRFDLVSAAVRTYYVSKSPDHITVTNACATRPNLRLPWQFCQFQLFQSTYWSYRVHRLLLTFLICLRLKAWNSTGILNSTTLIVCGIHECINTFVYFTFAACQ